MRITGFFLSMLILNYIFFSTACENNLDCTQCHYCDKISRKCIQIPTNTDPFDECGIKCDTKMVCGQKGYCVYQSPPHCDCDWKSSTCKENIFSSSSFKTQDTTSPSVFYFPPPPLPPPSLSSNTNLAPDDLSLIREVLAHHKSQNETPLYIRSFESEDQHHRVLLFMIFTKILAIVFLLFKKFINSKVNHSNDIEKQKK